MVNQLDSSGLAIWPLGAMRLNAVKPFRVSHVMEEEVYEGERTGVICHLLREAANTLDNNEDRANQPWEWKEYLLNASRLVEEANRLIGDSTKAISGSSRPTKTKRCDDGYTRFSTLTSLGWSDWTTGERTREQQQEVNAMFDRMDAIRSERLASRH